MRIVCLPLLQDNYAWLLCDEAAGTCAVVDPSEAGPVRDAIERLGLELRWILATHHHWDHTGGISELAAAGVEVVCFEDDRARVDGSTRGVTHDEGIEVAGRRARCLHVPGHTSGAIAFHFDSEQAVFTGDTLFTAGCGRLFEGTPAQMHSSLTRLAALPQDTLVYCGHEYTVANLRFAADLEPDNRAVAQRLVTEEARRHAGEPTVPAALSLERRTNPFLRSEDPALMQIVELEDPVEVLAEVRRRKDAFQEPLG